MKRAEDFVNEMYSEAKGGYRESKDLLLNAIRKAQREAYRAGLERAAEYTKSVEQELLDGDKSPYQLAEEILKLELPKELRD